MMGLGGDDDKLENGGGGGGGFFESFKVESIWISLTSNEGLYLFN